MLTPASSRWVAQAPGVAQGVNGDAPLVDARRFPGLPERSLDRIDRHGRIRDGAFLAGAAQCREKQSGMPMGRPIPAQQLIGLRRQRDKAVFGAFPAMDMERGALAVDIGNLALQGFLESKPAGIDCCQKREIVKCFDMVENTDRFRVAQNAWLRVFQGGRAGN